MSLNNFDIQIFAVLKTLCYVNRNQSLHVSNIKINLLLMGANSWKPI